jgi:hypothetical protein
MPPRKPYKPIASGVNFRPEVKEFLDRQGELEERDRSYLIDKAVRLYAATVGQPIFEKDIELLQSPKAA